MTRIITLDDGRHLAVEQRGDPDGLPVLFFHGIPGSRQFRHPDDSVARRQGVRLITFDRPGWGRSDPATFPNVSTAARDTISLLDQLDLEQVAVAGISGGVPHALAAAHAMPERVTGAALISSIGPVSDGRATKGMNRTNRWGLRIARHAAWLLPALLRPMASTANDDPASALSDAAADYAVPDREAMSRPEIQRMYLEDLTESYRQGTRGHSNDLRLMARPWGFDPEDVRVPATLWHGAQDRNVPRHVAERLAARLPGAELELVPDAGHLVLFDHWTRILERLAVHAPHTRRV